MSARTRAAARRPGHDRDRPPGPELGRRADEARAGPHGVLAGHLRGARLRRRALRPRHRAARAGAEPADVHGHDELLRRGRRRGRRRRGRARAGRHRPLQRALRHRLAPAGRGDGDAGLPARRRARRLLGDQGALARHRRQGSVLDGHGRRVPGGHDLPRRQAVRARAAGRGHLPLRDRQLAGAEDGRRRHQRDRRRRAHGRRGARRGSSSATASSASASARSRMYDARRGASCAAGSSSCPTAATSATARWTRTASTTTPCRSTSSSRSTARHVRLDYTNAPAAAGRARSTARCPRPSRPAGSRSPCWPAAARRRTRATSAPIEVVTRPGTLFHPLHPAPCFLYGWAGDQAIEAIYRARRRGAARGRARLQRRRHLRARLVGRARGDRRAVDRRRAAPGRPGRARAAATARAA